MSYPVYFPEQVRASPSNDFSISSSRPSKARSDCIKTCADTATEACTWHMAHGTRPPTKSLTMDAGRTKRIG